MAAFVALTIRRKMEIARERQGRPIPAATQHPMLDLAIPPVLAVSNPATEAEDDPGQASPLRRHPAANLLSRPEILIDPKTKGEYSRTVRTLE